MKFKVKIGKEISEKMVRDACAVDAIVYPENMRGDPDSCVGFFRKNPNIYTMIVNSDNNDLVGYINMMPLKEDDFKKLALGKFSDSEIMKNGPVAYDKPGKYWIYCCSIGIVPKYQNSAPVLMLISTVKSFIKRLEGKGFTIAGMAAEAISQDGEKMCKRLGFEKVCKSTAGYPVYARKGHFADD